MVEKVFWQDPYKTELDAVVTRAHGNSIWVDKTIFFAFYGGQASDKGTFNNINVVEAVKEEDTDDIHYVLESNPFKPGDRIHMTIDAEHRMRIMRLHGAAHVVDYFVLPKLGNPETIGSNVHEDKARLDFAYTESIAPMMAELQKEIDVVLSEPHAISVRGGSDDLRHWICEEIDLPCGGTHLKNTAEIGEIKLRRKNIGAGKERIEITLLA